MYNLLLTFLKRTVTSSRDLEAKVLKQDGKGNKHASVHSERGMEANGSSSRGFLLVYRLRNRFIVAFP